jgi:transposase
VTDFGWHSIWLGAMEVRVMQPSSLPVDRRARRAKTDVIDVEML